MKKKVTITITDKMADTVSYLGTVLQKNQNFIIENAFWEWWENQGVELKNSIDEMIELTKKVRDNNK